MPAMYEVLSLTEKQFERFQRELMSIADSIGETVRKDNYIMYTAEVPITVAISQGLYSLLLEQIPFLRECENLIVPRPDSIEEGPRWQFLYGDLEAFRSRSTGT